MWSETSWLSCCGSWMVPLPHINITYSHHKTFCKLQQLHHIISPCSNSVSCTERLIFSYMFVKMAWTGAWFYTACYLHVLCWSLLWVSLRQRHGQYNQSTANCCNTLMFTVFYSTGVNSLHSQPLQLCCVLLCQRTSHSNKHNIDLIQNLDSNDNSMPFVGANDTINKIMTAKYP